MHYVMRRINKFIKHIFVTIPPVVKSHRSNNTNFLEVSVDKSHHELWRKVLRKLSNVFLVNILVVWNTTVDNVDIDP